MRFLLTAILVAVPMAAPAPAFSQTTLKCRDAAGKITYSSEPCESLGLKNEGEVANRVTVAPATKAPRRAAEPASPPQKKAETPAAKAEPAEPKPERRCFKTAKGTRCNDVPPPDAEAPK